MWFSGAVSAGDRQVRLGNLVQLGSGLLQYALLHSAKKRGEADECFRLLSFPPVCPTVRKMPSGIILMKLWPFDHNVVSVITDASPTNISCIYSQQRCHRQHITKPVSAQASKKHPHSETVLKAQLPFCA